MSEQNVKIGIVMLLLNKSQIITLAHSIVTNDDDVGLHE